MEILGDGEDMDSQVLKWRRIVRITAYIDLFLCCLALAAGGVLIIWGATATAFLLGQDDKLEKEERSGMVPLVLWFFWLTLPITIVVISVNIWAVAKFIKSTEMVDDPTALNKAVIWRNVNIFFLLFASATSAISMEFELLAVTVLSRGAVLLIVRKFMVVLRETQETLQVPS